MFIPGGNRAVHCIPHEKWLQLPRGRGLILPLIVTIESSVTDENRLKTTTESPRHRKGGVSDHLPLESSQVAATCWQSLFRYRDQLVEQRRPCHLPFIVA